MPKPQHDPIDAPYRRAAAPGAISQSMALYLREKPIWTRGRKWAIAGMGGLLVAAYAGIQTYRTVAGPQDPAVCFARNLNIDPNLVIDNGIGGITYIKGNNEIVDINVSSSDGEPIATKDNASVEELNAFAACKGLPKVLSPFSPTDPS